MASQQDLLIARANKKFGAGALITGASLKSHRFTRVTTGSLALDLMLGGGFPVNCWNEIVGEPSSGKTAMVMKTIAANQERDPNYHCLWVASEDFVPAWAQSCGMDLDRCSIASIHIMEHAYDVIIEWIDNRACDAVVIDSLSALAPNEEVERSMDEWLVGLGARLTNKFMRKSGSVQKRSLDSDDRDCLGIIISQFRDKVGGYGDQRITPYGKGKEFHYMTRTEVRRAEWIERPVPNQGKLKVGITFKALGLKNKTAPARRLAEVDFYWEHVPGFDAGDYDITKEVFNIAKAFGILYHAGNGNYSYEGHKWRGEEKVLASVREEVDLRRSLAQDVMTRVLYSPPTPEPTPIQAAPSKQVIDTTEAPARAVRRVKRG